jgi:hypothetical protein
MSRYVRKACKCNNCGTHVHSVYRQNLPHNDVTKQRQQIKFWVLLHYYKYTLSPFIPTKTRIRGQACQEKLKITGG